MIRTSLSFGLVALLAVSTAACAAAQDDNASSDEPEITTPARPSTPSQSDKSTSEGEAPAKACVPKTCEELGESCGTPDDGCGGKAACGTCDGACTPKTCAQLGKSCGEHDDQCGKKVNCGACAPSCVADASGANNTAPTATVIGEFSDSPATNKTIDGLKLTDGDEDWYTMGIKDAGFSTNPRITASVGRPLQVTVFFVCKSATNYSTCPNAKDIADGLVGKGCKGTSSATLQTDCTGFDEAGTAYVRVRKLASDGLCAGYSLAVAVD